MQPRIMALKLFFFVAIFGSLLFGMPIFPKLSGRIVDEASILPPNQFAVLQQKLQQHETETTDQIVIVTLKGLQGYTIEEYGYQLGRHWGIGQKGKDNGLLLIVAPNERKVRIEVGYGLEGVMTDKYAHDIIQDEIIPSFKRGDFAGGIVNGTNAILLALKGQYVSKGPQDGGGDGDHDMIVANNISLAFVFLLFLYLAIEFFIIKKQKTSRFYWSLLASTLAGLFIWFLVQFFLVGFFVGIWVFVQAYFFKNPGSGWSSGGDFGGSSGGGSFGGGFSGGGGSFGGGGASGSW